MIGNKQVVIGLMREYNAQRGMKRMLQLTFVSTYLPANTHRLPMFWQLRH